MASIPSPVTLRAKAGGLCPQAVAAEVGGRNAQQVKHHYLYAQNLNLRKGPWTKEEDAALLKVRALAHLSQFPKCVEHGFLIVVQSGLPICCS